MERKYTFKVVSSFDGRSLEEVAKESNVNPANLKRTLYSCCGRGVSIRGGIIKVNSEKLIQELSTRQSTHRQFAVCSEGSKLPHEPSRPEGQYPQPGGRINFGGPLHNLFADYHDGVNFLNQTSRFELIKTLRRRGRVGGSKI